MPLHKFIQMWYNKTMKKSKEVKKNKLSIGKILFRIFLGFLIPYIVINGLFLYVYIQVPQITVFDSDSNNYEKDKIKFTVDCNLPINSIKVTHQDNEIKFSKINDIYEINVDSNGSYHIMATAFNGSVANWYGEVETIDSVPPKINVDTAIITGNTLFISISDDESNINYDELYAKLEDDSKTFPTVVDKALGTVQFQIEKGNKITVHLEDEYGNSSETPFTIAN